MVKQINKFSCGQYELDDLRERCSQIEKVFISLDTEKMQSSNNDILKIKNDLKIFEEKISEEKMIKVRLNNDSYNHTAALIWHSLVKDIKSISEKINLLEKKIKSSEKQGII